MKNEALINFRESNNLTQQQMADKIGVSLSLYQKVEKGERNSSFNFICRFKHIYPNADIESIFFAQKPHGTCSGCGIQNTGTEG
ncbi:MAG: helix-turn-helix transcriptional regulator [Syntrophomonadales bacterium]